MSTGFVRTDIVGKIQCGVERTGLHGLFSRRKIYGIIRITKAFGNRVAVCLAELIVRKTAREYSADILRGKNEQR